MNRVFSDPILHRKWYQSPGDPLVYYAVCYIFNKNLSPLFSRIKTETVSVIAADSFIIHKDLYHF